MVFGTKQRFFFHDFFCFCFWGVGSFFPLLLFLWEVVGGRGEGEREGESSSTIFPLSPSMTLAQNPKYSQSWEKDPHIAGVN